MDRYQKGLAHGYEDALAAVREGASAPLLDRETAVRVISGASNPAESDTILGRKYVGNWADVFADAVMALARPMPTQEQIDAFLQEWRVRPGGHRTQTEAVNYRRKMRNALLALLNGES